MLFEGIGRISAYDASHRDGIEYARRGLYTSSRLDVTSYRKVAFERGRGVRGYAFLEVSPNPLYIVPVDNGSVQGHIIPVASSERIERPHRFKGSECAEIM